MPYTGIYVFGDSLVDAGNALKLAQFYKDLTFSDLPENAPSAADGYFMGRFSNGFTFADLLSNKLLGTPTKPVFPFGFDDPWIGLPISPFGGDPSGKNLNFAYGGAQIIQGGEVVPDLDGQTDAFWDAVDNRPDPNALYLFTIGGNDVRALARYDREPVNSLQAHFDLYESAERMIDELSLLINRGAKNIVITGIADVGLIPAYDLDDSGALDSMEQRRASAATEYSLYLDLLLRTKVVPALQAIGGNVTFVPVMDTVDSTGAAHAGAFSAALATIAALNGLTPEQLRGGVLQHRDLIFFDDVHPTAQVHALVAGYLNAQINGGSWTETLPARGADVDYRAAGSLAAAGEVDGGTIAMVAGTTYRFEALGLGALGAAGSVADLSLKLLGPGGGLAAADDDSGVGLDATLTVAAAATGNHVLQLSATGSLTGSYVLQGLVMDGAALHEGNTYVVDNAATLVLEGVGGVGEDVVATSVSYTLAADSEIELLRTTNDAGSAAIDLAGNRFGQAIRGNVGANVLDGGAGDDTLSGRGGADRLIGGSGRDLFRDTAAGLDGDTIADFAVGDRIIIADAQPGAFGFSLSGTSLTYAGGQLSLGGVSPTALTASAAAGGGVQLAITVAVRNDFNGDGRADTLWRRADGLIGSWTGQANGALTANAASNSPVPTDWRIAGTGDFNGDGRSDILWRHANGQFGDWLANSGGGFAYNAAAGLTAVTIDWKIAGTGDFNGDGRDDILWRSDSGQFGSWLANASGGFAYNAVAGLATLTTDWRIFGTGDYDGDGRDDILWRNDNGQFGTWLANASGGFAYNATAGLTSVTTDWRIVGSGDFNGDGRDDILWRNGSTGQFGDWLATSGGGFAYNAAAGLTTVSLEWTIADIGDYNGDGRDDILWRNASGDFGDWLANANGGFAFNAAGGITSLATSWQVQPQDTLFV